MKKKIVIALMILVTLQLSAIKYAGEIFRIGAGVRNYALGHNGLTDTESSSIAYWNPALLSKIQGNNVEFMHSEEFNGLLKNDVISGSISNKYAITISRVAIDDIVLTKLENEDDSLYYANRPYAYKYTNNADYIVFFGFSRKIKNIDFGITPKIVYRSLAEKYGFGFGANLSVFNKFNHFYSIGANLRNISTSQIFWENGTIETVNPSLDLENKFSFDLPLVGVSTKLFLGSEIYTDSRDFASMTNLGTFSIDWKFGSEFEILDNLDLLAGYYNHNLTAGFDLNISQFGIAYSFEMNHELDNSHRVGIEYNF
ncbi:MAG: hypothetical protein U9N34_06235 [Candidatus Cloacimonadota bacterium]|nr:hypothetical protein [Candidatus Cloacimonadota bacterium]